MSNEQEAVVSESAEQTKEDIPTWTGSVSEEYLENAEIKSYVEKGDINLLLKSFREKQKVAGQKGSPKADAPQEEWNEFYKSKGLLPDSADGYGIEDPLFGEIAETALTAGLSKNQAKVLTEKLAALKAGQDELSNKQYEESYSKLVEKYGGEAEAKEVLSQADKYAQETFGDFPEFFDFLSSSTIKTPGGEVLLGNHPMMAEALKIMFEKTADDGKRVQGESAGTSEDAATRFEQLTSEMAKYSGDKSDPEYRKMITEYQKVINAMNS